MYHEYLENGFVSKKQTLNLIMLYPMYPKNINEFTVYHKSAWPKALSLTLLPMLTGCASYTW